MSGLPEELMDRLFGWEDPRTSIAITPRDEISVAAFLSLGLVSGLSSQRYRRNAPARKAMASPAKLAKRAKQKAQKMARKANR